MYKPGYKYQDFRSSLDGLVWSEEIRKVLLWVSFISISMNEYVFRIVLAQFYLMKKSNEFFPVHLLSICLYMHLSANLLHFKWKIKTHDQTFLKGRSNYQYVNRVGHLELEYLLLKNYCTRKQHFYVESILNYSNCDIKTNTWSQRSAKISWFSGPAPCS